jgi:hypothetical protein
MPSLSIIGTKEEEQTYFDKIKEEARIDLRSK